MNKDNKRRETSAPEDDYVSLDITSATECTGMVPTPPLTEAEVEGYSSVYSVPQKRVPQKGKNSTPKKKQAADQ